MRPVTAVDTNHAEVGVLIDTPGSEIPALASVLSAEGIHASFTVDLPSPPVEMSVSSYGDEAVPRLPTGGLVRWLHTRGELRRLVGTTGYRHHFLYASSGPSVGQWWLAHKAGGRLVAGAVRLQDKDDVLGPLRAGEVVEISPTSPGQLQPLLDKLDAGLTADHLAAVSVGRLMRDATPSA
jgi:hypothetical protein